MADPPDRLGIVFGWLQVLRLPDALIVPGGVFAGYALASRGFQQVEWVPLAAVFGAGLLLAMGGHALNDWFDLPRDIVKHPDRPLPAGVVKPIPALALAVGLLAAGVACAWHAGLAGFGIAFVLALLIVFYNAWARGVPALGTCVLALLHAGVVILGAAAAPVDGSEYTFVPLAAGVTWCFAAATSAIARSAPDRFPGTGPLIVIAVSPVLLLLSGFQGIFLGGWTCVGLWVLWFLFTYTTWFLLRNLWRLDDPAKTPGMVPFLYRNLIIMQAFWAAASGASCFHVAVPLLLWPIAGFLSRRL